MIDNYTVSNSDEYYHEIDIDSWIDYDFNYVEDTEEDFEPW